MFLSSKAQRSVVFSANPILFESVHLRNEFDFWKVHGILNTSGILQSYREARMASLTLQETRSIHDSINLPKIEFIAYIYILYYQSSINFQF